MKADTSKGHLAACAPEITPDFRSCICDGVADTDRGWHATREIKQAMVKTGWTSRDHDDHDNHGLAFYRTFNKHIVTVARVYDGWQYIWQRGPTWTIREDRGFGTVHHCLAALWQQVFENYDRLNDLDTERAVRLITRSKLRSEFLVVIARELVTMAYPFSNEEDAKAFYDQAGANWSESFLCEVLKGPLIHD